MRRFVFVPIVGSFFFSSAFAGFIPAPRTNCKIHLDGALTALADPTAVELRRTDDLAAEAPFGAPELRKTTTPDISEPVVYFVDRSGREKGDTDDALESSAARLLYLENAFAEAHAAEAKRRMERKALARQGKQETPVVVDPNAQPPARMLVLEGVDLTQTNVAEGKPLFSAAPKTHEHEETVPEVEVAEVPPPVQIDDDDGKATVTLANGKQYTFDYYNPAGSVVAAGIMKVRPFPTQARLAHLAYELGLVWVTPWLATHFPIPSIGMSASLLLDVLQGILHMVHIHIGPQLAGTIYCAGECGYGIWRDYHPEYVEEIEPDAQDEPDAPVDSVPPRNFTQIALEPAENIGRALSAATRTTSRADSPRYFHIGLNYYLPAGNEKLANNAQQARLDADGDYELPTGTIDPRETTANRTLDLVYYMKPGPAGGPEIPVLLVVDMPKPK